jgi:hypothetical protein
MTDKFQFIEKYLGVNQPASLYTREAFLFTYELVNFPDKHCICVHKCKNTAYLFQDTPYF